MSKDKNIVTKPWLFGLTFIGLAALTPTSQSLAVPAALQCNENQKVNCVKNDVLIIEGTPDLLLEGGCVDGTIRLEGLVRWNCVFDRQRVMARVNEVLANSGSPTPEWDQVVLFSADSEQFGVFGGRAKDPMMFYREGGADGVSDVGGIGIEMKPRVPGKPYVGYVVGGSTTTFGLWERPRNEAEPLQYKFWPLPDPAGVKNFAVRYRGCGPEALCFDGANGYQALAQATSQMFGPYVREEIQLQGEKWYAFNQDQRSQCVPEDQGRRIAVPPSLYSAGSTADGGVSDGSAGTDAAGQPRKIPSPSLALDTGGAPLLDLNQISGTRVTAPAGQQLAFGEPALAVCPDQKNTVAFNVRGEYYDVDPVTGIGKRVVAQPLNGVIRPRIWNAFMDLDGSLMGGGSNWYENGNGTASNGGPAAFEAGSAPLRGRRMSVFHPIELWLMGFAASPEVETKVYNVRSSDLIGVEATLDAFQKNAGPRMGMPTEGLAVGAKEIQIFSDARLSILKVHQLLQVPEGQNPRVPTFEQAPHYIRQLWVLVTKPEDKVGGVDSGLVDQINEEHTAHILRWRRAWQQYFYALTSYYGRVRATFDQTYDDSAYWEFMQKTDDEKSFTPRGGLSFEVSGWRKDPNSTAILSYANVSTPGAAGEMEFTPHAPQQLPVRIDGRLVQQVRSPTFTEDKDKFVIYGDNALMVRMQLPFIPGEPKKDWPKAVAKLRIKNGPEIRIPADDDRLTNDEKAYLVWDGKFHTYAVDLRKIEGYEGKVYDDGFTFVPSEEPVDCTTTVTEDPYDEDDCIKLDFIRFTNVADPDDAADLDRDCTGALKPDGFIGIEDNCSLLYNPDQADADGNGIGDACEDFDFDGIPNRCDNCPTVSNARQGDRDENDIGDACDDNFRGGCALQPDSVAGAASSSGSSIPLMLLGLAVAGIFGFRLSRNGRKKR